MTERISEKWRPRSVNEIVGQPEAVEILSAWIADPIATAWAFVGPPSSGKTTAAMCIAEYLYNGSYPTPECVNGSQLAVADLPSLHRAQLICSPFTCGKSEHHWHVLIVDEFERISPQAQNWMKTEWEVLPPRAVILATSNSLEAISDACVQRFQVIEFAGGGEFEKAALNRCVQIWQTEITKRFGVEAPTFAELRKLGDSRGQFSLRACLNKIEQKLAILTHNAKPRELRNREAETNLKF